MNRSFRLVCNDATERHDPAPETARRPGMGRPGMGRPGQALAPTALLLGALLAPAAGAQALPTGPQVTAGQAKVQVNGHQMTITQSTPKAIVQWQGFDIGKDSKVHFDQRSGAHSIALNRVVGGNASRIDGQLSANGQVWLVNPHGVVFGQGSSVNVGGLVASALDIANEDFEAGRQLFTRGAAQGGVTNHGEITVADGATLALLAPTVRNEGLLRARLGNVVLAGGDQVTLQAGADGRLQVAVDPATVRTLIENRKLVMADGGQVVMTASAANALSASVVANSGTVQARTVESRNGRILLLSDLLHGELVHSGLLDASAAERGHGGFVDTGAARVSVEPGARVTTAAAQGETAHWKVTSTADLVIHAGKAPEAVSGIAADALDASLAQTHVELHLQPPYEEKRSIHVNAPVRYERHRLALNARHDIDINARVSVEGTGTLHLNYGGTNGYADALPAAGSNLHVKPGQGQVDFAKAGAHLLSINGEGYTVLHGVAALQAVGESHRLGGKYALGRSLDASNVDFEPIGEGQQHPFTGSFDGLGHSIRNLDVDRQDRHYAGLFGHAVNATLRNVKLEQANVQGGFYTGALVGRNDAIGGTAQISHVQVTGKVSGERFVGALAGANIAENGGAARISQAHSTGQVWGHSFVGGLVGENKTLGSQGSVARIDHAHSSAAVVGKEGYVGGLVGINEARSVEGLASISNAHASGLVFGESDVGGLVGLNLASSGGMARIRAAHATGQVSGMEFSGGLVGRNTASTGATSAISQVHATGHASGQSAIGGLVGSNGQDASSAASISNAHAAGNVSGDIQVGGLVGLNRGTPLLNPVHATGEVKGNALVGELVGQHEDLSPKAVPGPALPHSLSMLASPGTYRPQAN